MMDPLAANLFSLQFHACIFLYQGAAKVSIVMIGQQAIMDAYLCLLQLTAGILVGKLTLSFFLLV